MAPPLHVSSIITMRALLALPVLALAASTAHADGRPISLSAQDIGAALSPHQSAIQHCYLDHTTDVYGAGKLSIELTITRKGELATLAIKTPGLDTAVGVKVASCIADTLDALSFPARRTQTTATVPYFFQRTLAAGPYESCWKAAGCPTERPAVAAAPRPAAATASVRRAARHDSSSHSRTRASRHANASLR